METALQIKEEIRLSRQLKEVSCEEAENLVAHVTCCLPVGSSPAVAQKTRSDKGGKVTGIARSDKVQAENKKSVKDRDPNPSKGSKSKKTRTREGWEKNAKHKGSNK